MRTGCSPPVHKAELNAPPSLNIYYTTGADFMVRSSEPYVAYYVTRLLRGELAVDVGQLLIVCLAYQTRTLRPRGVSTTYRMWQLTFRNLWGGGGYPLGVISVSVLARSVFVPSRPLRPLHFFLYGKGVVVCRVRYSTGLFIRKICCAQGELLIMFAGKTAGFLK